MILLFCISKPIKIRRIGISLFKTSFPLGIFFSLPYQARPRLGAFHTKLKVPIYICNSFAAAHLHTKDPFPQSSETLPGTLHPSLGSPAQEGQGPVGVSPEERQQDDLLLYMPCSNGFSEDEVFE